MHNDDYFTIAFGGKRMEKLWISINMVLLGKFYVQT